MMGMPSMVCYGMLLVFKRSVPVIQGELFMKHEFGSIDMENVIEDAVGDILSWKSSKEDVVMELLRQELPEGTEVDYHKLIPNMPEDIEPLKPAKEFLLYCRQIAIQFLEATEYLSNAESKLDSLDYEILVAESRLKNNALKFYKAFHLQEKLKERCMEKTFDRAKLFEELMRLLTETECHIIYTYNGKYDDVKSISELKCKLGLKELQEDAAKEFYEYYKYCKGKITDYSLGKCIAHINSESSSLSEIKNEARREVLDALEGCQLIYQKLFYIFPSSAQELICQSIYKDTDLYGWRTRWFIRGKMQGILEAFHEEWSNEEGRKRIEEKFEVFVMFRRFMEELTELTSVDEQYIQADQDERSKRLIELVEQLL